MQKRIWVTITIEIKHTEDVVLFFVLCHSKINCDLYSCDVCHHLKKKIQPPEWSYNQSCLRTTDRTSVNLDRLRGVFPGQCMTPESRQKATETQKLWLVYHLIWLPTAQAFQAIRENICRVYANVSTASNYSNMGRFSSFSLHITANNWICSHFGTTGPIWWSSSPTSLSPATCLTPAAACLKSLQSFFFPSLIPMRMHIIV